MTLKEIQSLKAQTRQLPHLYKSFKKELLAHLDECEKYLTHCQECGNKLIKSERATDDGWCRCNYETLHKL